MPLSGGVCYVWSHLHIDSKSLLFYGTLPVAHIAARQRRTSLASAQAIQKTELALLRLPYPIIAVFDENSDIDYTTLEIVWSDGIVIPALLEKQFSERQNVKIAQHPTDVASAILELLNHAEAVPATELFKNRQETLIANQLSNEEGVL